MVREYNNSLYHARLDVLLVKHWIRRHYRQMMDHDAPVVMLHEACGSVTAAKAQGWFRHSGYIQAHQE